MMLPPKDESTGIEVQWHPKPSLRHVLNRLAGTEIGEDSHRRATEAVSLRFLLSPVDYAAALQPFTWLLNRAAGKGTPLTAAGYMTPAVVREFAPGLPVMDGYISKLASEFAAGLMLRFRETLQEIKLLRKYKGTSRLAQLGRSALADPEYLWSYLQSCLTRDGHPFDNDASVVRLVHLATSPEGAD